MKTLIFHIALLLLLTRSFMVNAQDEQNIEPGTVCIYISDNIDRGHLPQIIKDSLTQSLDTLYQLTVFLSNWDSLTTMKVGLGDGKSTEFKNETKSTNHVILIPARCLRDKLTYWALIENFEYCIPLILGYKYCSIYRMDLDGYIYVRYFNEFLQED